MIYVALAILLELLPSEANVSIFSRDSRQPIKANPQSEGEVFINVRWSDSSNDTSWSI